MRQCHAWRMHSAYRGCNKRMPVVGGIVESESEPGSEPGSEPVAQLAAG